MGYRIKSRFPSLFHDYQWFRRRFHTNHRDRSRNIFCKMYRIVRRNRLPLVVGSERGSAFERPTNSARGKGKTIVNNIDIIRKKRKHVGLIVIIMFFP